MDPTTGASRQLTNDVRSDFQPRWSPDGRWVAFLSDRGGQTDLWMVPAAGGAARRLTNDQALEVNPRWAADGRSIYYARNELQVDVQLIPAAGGAPRTLFTWAGYDIIDVPQPSRDGRSILFVSSRSGNLDIWSVPSSGGEPTPFVANALNDDRPRYSPDGTQVLFTAVRGTETDLWVIPSTGGEARNLTNAPGIESEALWSPDGSRVAFASDRDGRDLWVIPAAGGAATRVTRGNVRPASLLWSPDGRYLYYVGNRAGGGRELFRVSADGGEIEALGADPGVNNSAISPDGSMLSYSTMVGGWAFVDVIPSSGGTPRRLTRDTTAVYHPRAMWYPDGTRLLVHDLDLASSRDATDLLSVRVADATWERITRTEMASEATDRFMPDGRDIVAVARTFRTQIRRLQLDDAR
jgi:TolB protein